jgi:hypothetical protein
MDMERRRKDVGCRHCGLLLLLLMLVLVLVLPSLLVVGGGFADPNELNLNELFLGLLKSPRATLRFLVGW